MGAHMKDVYLTKHLRVSVLNDLYMRNNEDKK